MTTDEDIKRMTSYWTRAQPAVGRFVRGFVRNSAEADDVLQEIALVIVDRYDSYDLERPFIGWAMGIARRVVGTQLRKKYRDQDVILSDAVEQAADAFERLDPYAQNMKDALGQRIEQVQGPSREALRLRCEEGLEVSEIGTSLGRSASNVGVMLHRVRTVLRDCVQRQLGTGGV